MLATLLPAQFAVALPLLLLLLLWLLLLVVERLWFLGACPTTGLHSTASCIGREGVQQWLLTKSAETQVLTVCELKCGRVLEGLQD